MTITKTTLKPAVAVTAVMSALGIAIATTGFSPVVSAQSADLRIDMHADSQRQAAFSQQDLDRMLAPIALYPDELLSQMLMAATYPLEVVEAARWSRGHPGLDGDEAVRAAARMDWDPSVQSMVAFPQVLSMMDEKIEWTEDLGNAFLAQEPRVMDTIQLLRDRAQAAGNLHSTDQVRIEQQGSTWLIASANSQVVYVPYYDPAVIYGRWWWPVAPVYWRPWPGYYPRSGVRVGFYFGNGVSLSAGYFFGRFDWPRRSVNVVYVNNYYDTVVVRNGRPERRIIADARNYNRPVQWHHNPEHRGSVPYRSPELRREYALAPAQRAFEQRRDAVRHEPSRPGAFAQVEQRTQPRAQEAGTRTEVRREARDDARHDGRRTDANVGANVESNVESRASGNGRFNNMRNRADARPAASAPAPVATAPAAPAVPPQARPESQRPAMAERAAERRAEARTEHPTEHRAERHTERPPAPQAERASPARIEARPERREEARDEQRRERRNDQAARSEGPRPAQATARDGREGREARQARDERKNPGAPS